MSNIIKPKTGNATPTTSNIIDREIAYSRNDKKLYINDNGEIKNLSNVQADWNQANNALDDYIKNKPTIPTVITDHSALSNLTYATAGHTGFQAALSAGNSITIAAGVIDTIQDIRTSATPQFAKLGIGTATIPHGAVGWALFAVEGANASSAGPHIQYTTATDDYPLFQQLNFTHDNITLGFDSYYDGVNFKSSDAGSSYQIRKVSDQLQLNCGVAAAGSAITFLSPFIMTSTGAITLTAQATTTIPLTIKGKASQSANRINITDSADGTPICVTAGGILGVGTLTPPAYGEKFFIDSGAGKNIMLGVSTQSSTVDVWNNAGFGISQGTATANNYAVFTFYTAAWNDAAAMACKYIEHGAGNAKGQLHYQTSNGAAGLITRMIVDENGDITIVDGDLIVSTSNGTKIATATNQKLGIYGKTPVVQQTALTTQLTTITASDPGTPDYAIANLTQTSPYGFVSADEGQSLLKVIANLQTRLAELETRLSTYGWLP